MSEAPREISEGDLLAEAPGATVADRWTLSGPVSEEESRSGAMTWWPVARVGLKLVMKRWIFKVFLGLGLMKDGTLLTGEAAWQAQYASWSAAGSLPAKVGAFVNGSANFLQALGLSAAVSVALMGVLVASFAGTTLDTACRLQRYVVQELATTLGGGPLAVLQNKHGATIFAVVIAAAMAAVPPGGAEWSVANARQGRLVAQGAHRDGDNGRGDGDPGDVGRRPGNAQQGRYDAVLFPAQRAHDGAGVRRGEYTRSRARQDHPEDH